MTAREALVCVPFDPATMEPGVRRNYMIDDETWWDRKTDRGENGVIVLRPGEEDPENFLCAEDTTGEKHFFVRKEQFKQEEKVVIDEEQPNNDRKKSNSSWDKSAVNEIMSLRSSKRISDMEPGDDFVERVWQRVNSGKLNWKKLLSSFIQEEVCDYSFTPPDRRLQDSDFFLPDYTVLTERPKEVFFMVDTSDSIDDDMLSVVYSEIYNALTQFNGGLVGTLVFFDMRVYTPISFDDVGDLPRIKPRGGGGTDFNCIFNYARKNFTNDSPVDIVIFTDGQACFPDETAANNIPVLWLFSNRNVIPPWGKYAYVDIIK